LSAQWRASRPRWLAAGVAACTVVAVLSFGEVAVVQRVQPPGAEVLARVLLDNMHYQRSEMVILTARALAVAAAMAAGLLAVAIHVLRRDSIPARGAA